MLAELPQINGAMQGVGFLVGSQRPFITFLIKNWPLALIGALAMYGKVRERHKAKDLSAYNTLADLGLVLSPLVGLALLKQLAQQDEERKAAAARLVTPMNSATMVYPPAPA